MRKRMASTQFEMNNAFCHFAFLIMFTQRHTEKQIFFLDAKMTKFYLIFCIVAVCFVINSMLFLNKRIVNFLFYLWNSVRVAHFFRCHLFYKIPTPNACFWMNLKALNSFEIKEENYYSVWWSNTIRKGFKWGTRAAASEEIFLGYLFIFR